jgi:acyl carrier protein
VNAEATGSDLDRLLAIVRDQLCAVAGAIGPSTRAADIRGWDSVAMVNILFALEETFGVEFTSLQMEQADGIASLRRILREARGA